MAFPGTRSSKKPRNPSGLQPLSPLPDCFIILLTRHLADVSCFILIIEAIQRRGTDYATPVINHRTFWCGHQYGTYSKANLIPSDPASIYASHTFPAVYARFVWPHPCRGDQATTIICWHIEAATRRHFQTHFDEWKYFSFHWNFTEIYSQWSNWQSISNGSDNGLAPNSRHAIIWANTCKITWTIMYVLLWRTASTPTRGLFWCLFSELRSNERNTHQNNTRVGTETV